MDLSLNADAALRAYLPPEAWNGGAQHRFLFRTEDGEEEPLLARLAVVRSDKENRRFEHCVLLRPEVAEPTRIFVCQGYWPRCNPWMTPHAARLFRWWLFEHNLRGDGHRAKLSRFWLKREQNSDILLRFDGNGWGVVCAFEDEQTGCSLYSQGFIWDHDNQGSSDQLDLRFLRQDDASFQHQVRSCYDSPDGEIATTLKWQHLDENERDAIAFHCQNGSWNELLDIATSALKVRIAHLPHQLNETYRWNLADVDGVFVFEVGLFCDSFLSQWLTAVMQVFQPDNLNAGGNMVSERPFCLWSHISDSELSSVQVEPPSQHELLEAQLQLREWANAHFPPKEAQRLLAL